MLWINAALARCKLKQGGSGFPSRTSLRLAMPEVDWGEYAESGLTPGQQITQTALCRNCTWAEEARGTWQLPGLIHCPENRGHLPGHAAPLSAPESSAFTKASITVRSSVDRGVQIYIHVGPGLPASLNIKGEIKGFSSKSQLRELCILCYWE